KQKVQFAIHTDCPADRGMLGIRNFARIRRRPGYGPPESEVGPPFFQPAPQVLIGTVLEKEF
ncbi:MAG: hypothetical protein KDC75_13730, partial [Phaeodactylibacter sp.]|nr:hypothetical protein [Phaeodactylibacter sp.]